MRITDTQRIERLERLVRKYPIPGEVIIEATRGRGEEPRWRLLGFDVESDTPSEEYAGSSLREVLDALIQRAP